MSMPVGCQDEGKYVIVCSLQVGGRKFVHVSPCAIVQNEVKNISILDMCKKNKKNNTVHHSLKEYERQKSRQYLHLRS